MLLSYLEQLEALAVGADIVLADAFKKAGIAKTTLYRARKNQFYLSHAVAGKVADAIATTPLRHSRKSGGARIARPAKAKSS